MSALNQGLLDAGYRTCVLDYSSVRVSIDAMLDETSNQLNQCTENAQVVHLVGHSLGGLLIRYHLQADDSLQVQNRLGKVVMLGTPNHGSEVADHYSTRFWANWFGEVPISLVTSKKGFAQSLNEPNYEFAIIAGIKPFKTTDSLFQKPNDGLVSVESAKLSNMQDFIELPINHMRLRDDPEAIHQVVYYLQKGRFDHPTSITSADD
ncbi:esterase/lipase family protein [Vibrio paucivorans]